MLFRSREFVSLHLGAREDEFTPVRGIAGAVVSGAVLLSALSLPLYALAASDFSHAITSAAAWRAAADGDGVADPRATGFVEKDGRITLSLESGRTITGDALIGCDGVNSMVRRLTAADSPPEFAKMMIWRGVLPLKALPPRMQASMAVNWIGPNGHCVHYPLRDGEIMNLAATIEKPVWDEETWSAEGRKEQCHQDYAGWHEDVHILIDAAPRLLKWAYLVRKELNRYAFGRAALLGDACHPTLPFLAQGAVMALEDGVVLARCLEKYEDVPEALRAYERARLERDNAMVRDRKSTRLNSSHT